MQLFKHQVNGYKGLYEIDNYGNVYSMLTTNGRRKGKLKPEFKNGYLSVGLTNSKSKCIRYYVHRLVAQAFIPNPAGHKEVNHIDCNGTNNHVKNLEWCTRSYNVRYSYTVGGRSSNRETHIKNNYRGLSCNIYNLNSNECITFKNMKDASIYLGKNIHYVSENRRRKQSDIFELGGHRIEVIDNE